MRASSLWAMQVPVALQAADDGLAQQHSRDSLLGALLGFALRQSIGPSDVADLAAKLRTPSELGSGSMKSGGKYVERVRALLRYIVSADEVFSPLALDSMALGLGAKPSTRSFVGGLLALRDVVVHMGIGGSASWKAITSLTGRVSITAAFLALRAHYLGDGTAQVRARALANLHRLQEVS